MNTNDLGRSLPSLFRELTYGVPETGGFVLNRGDAGLLASLDRLSAAEASTSSQGGATVAAHAAHLAYGLSLMNHWAAGENPFLDADWAAAWRTAQVSEEEWAGIRDNLRGQIDRWLETLASPREVSGIELDGVLGSMIHLGYHLGAIRQIVAGSRGPKEVG